jgi:hypothetical protein
MYLPYKLFSMILIQRAGIKEHVLRSRVFNLHSTYTKNRCSTWLKNLVSPSLYYKITVHYVCSHLACFQKLITGTERRKCTVPYGSNNFLRWTAWLIPFPCSLSALWSSLTGFGLSPSSYHLSFQFLKIYSTLFYSLMDPEQVAFTPQGDKNFFKN